MSLLNCSSLRRPAPQSRRSFEDDPPNSAGTILIRDHRESRTDRYVDDTKP
jgi:hypothetical protein